jgi:hypothetical protein
MDWPVIGAVSAVAIIAGAVTFEVVVFMQSDPAPVKRAPRLASYEASVDRSAYEIPGFASGKPAEWTPSFPLIPLIDPDRAPQAEGRVPADQPAAPKAPRIPPAASVAVKPPPPGDQPGTPPPAEFNTAKPATPEVQQPRAEQWRVIVTAKASYFNLGGHVDSAGIVDSLASSHLRDALKSHRNFTQLPPEIRTHILTQNINLTKVAPYRGLLGMNDKTLEEEQAVRFERVAANR